MTISGDVKTESFSKNKLGKVHRVFDKINLIGVAISGGLITFAMVMITLDVIFRYAFNRPLSWEAPISEHGLLFMLCLSSAYVLKKGRHINMTYVVDRLKPRARHMLEAITCFLCAAALVPLVWYGVQVWFRGYQQNLYRSYEAKWLLDGYTIWVIPVGMLLLLIQFLINAYSQFKLAKGENK